MTSNSLRARPGTVAYKHSIAAMRTIKARCENNEDVLVSEIRKECKCEVRLERLVELGIIAKLKPRRYKWTWPEGTEETAFAAYIKPPPTSPAPAAEVAQPELFGHDELLHKKVDELLNLLRELTRK